MIRRAKVRQLLGPRSLPTVFYGMLTVSFLCCSMGCRTTNWWWRPIDDKPDRGFRRATVGRPRGRSFGARGPTLVAYTAIILAGLGLAATVNTVWGLFIFGVLGVAAAWSLSTLMYVWVADGVPKAEHA